MISIQKGTLTDCNFIYNALEVLRDGLDINYSQFENYYTHVLKLTTTEFIIGNDLENNQIGLITLNRFEIPRYMGYGIEMEEVVVLEKYRGKGYAKQMIELIFEKYKIDTACRKLLVKTDGEEAMKLYEHYFSKTSLCHFQKYLNKV